MSDHHVCKLAPAPAEEALPDSESTFGLTADEKAILGSSWALVRADLAGTGVAVLTTFFVDYPNNLTYFPFKHDVVAPSGVVDEDALRASPVVRSHAIRVMRQLDTVVASIQKPNTVVHALKQNALNHRHRQIHKSSYDELRVSILKTLAAAFGPEVIDAHAASVWDKALTVIFGAITDVNNDDACCCEQ